MFVNKMSCESLCVYDWVIYQKIWFQDDIVKLQMMNLAVKLYITNPEQTELLCQYIFNLARYDQNYDIRDRARVLRQFVCGKDGVIKSKTARIFLANKPAPLLQNSSKGRFVKLKKRISILWGPENSKIHSKRYNKPSLSSPNLNIQTWSFEIKLFCLTFIYRSWRFSPGLFSTLYKTENQWLWAITSIPWTSTTRWREKCWNWTSFWRKCQCE